MNCTLSDTQKIIAGLGFWVGVLASAPILAGFGTAGIVGGSTAAAIQSSIGCVASGSAFAILQSLGMTGILSTVARLGTATGIGSIGSSILGCIANAFGNNTNSSLIK